ncbi:hypothetical protein [Flavobacterium kingsejongi]|uniref:hypothetical protein n=1 Tax=Flavobacterium kingsejongi TaxID=1678728 RepID=UPI0013007AA3|nr:hypothetical protein [Flavobacterium kingsejongi]
MRHKFYILVLVTLGLLFGPTLSFSHGMEPKMSCCHSESASQSCCREKETQSKEHHCDNSCKGVSCGCPTVYCGYAPILLQTETNSLFGFSDKKQNFFYSEIFIATDSRAIWLPPKIS